MSLPIKTLFFAAYREILGTSELAVEMGPGTTIGDLVRELRSRGAPFDALPEEPAIALNRAYAAPSELLAAGDEVAFIPPVAGG